ncbi:MAG TPA: 5'/3'-nucleotidase SurE [Acidimicrobiia bacterium]|nr:5'/3'-nucleotidase SurE [Acidimicrobiia bacterium]
MRILLTNDDGTDAPGLAAFARTLQEVGEVGIVVPDRERSWVSKAITRFEPVSVTPVDVDGVPVMACSGFPADCVQLGIHAVFDRPDVVVSGINIGYNHGSAYLQSSGTVGAALEAGIAGVPALAFSTGSHTVPWQHWREEVLRPNARPMWERLASVAAAIVAEAVPFARPGDVLNIGLPDDSTHETKRELSRVAASGYDRLFREEQPGVYAHAYGGLIHDPDAIEGTDVGAAMEGVISISQIRGAGDDGINQELIEALAQ